MTLPAAATALLPRQELFAHHVARGASLAQAVRLAGYSPHGARQRGSVLMANDDIRIRVETLRRSWLAEREKHIGEAVKDIAQVIDKALRLERPATAIKALELKLKLQGIIRDPRIAPSPRPEASRRPAGGASSGRRVMKNHDIS
jgi:phage terminase small subunit